LQKSARARWFRKAHVRVPETLTGHYYEHFFLSLQAALNGLGAAIVPAVLVESDFEQGLLMTPFPEIAVENPGFYALYRDSVDKEPDLQVFVRWLLSSESRRSANLPDRGVSR
jgi:LysR family glycine cleavage system transcriptional activator